jgi:nucleoside-diphosphate-sugar epimerase
MKDVRGSEILITGGAGFIGSNLARQLVLLGARVTILDSYITPYGGNSFNLFSLEKSIRLVKGDVRSRELLTKLVDGKDFIFHLAGQTGRVISMNQPELDIDINCLGTVNILEAIKIQSRKAKIIFTSSRGVIGEPKYLPVNEDHPVGPKDMYGADKLAAEWYIRIYGNEYSMPFTILRLNNVYGPRCQIRSNHYGTINLFISYALQKKEIPVYGDGTQTRDYVYIDDTVDALIRSCNKKADGEIYFVGTGVPHTLLSVVEIIEKYVDNTKFRIVDFPKDLAKIDFHDFYSDSSKITKHLGWKPTFELSKGIALTVEYYKKYLQKYL